MLIGVISDTHGYLDPRAVELFQGVEHILHAGDIGDDLVIHKLNSIAPVTVVKGNVDQEPPVSLYPEAQVVELGVHRIYVTHALKPPRKEDDPCLQKYCDERIDIVVYGHSHIAYRKRWGDVLFFNPGAAGKRRFKVVPSVGFLTLTELDAYGQITAL